ncbi:hypothetical protein CS063_12890 [Sporanaerobium hydrogeniformans]|uniref:Uncharacterized protein n=1 Tax=Sporanaerobium hydrogeniformans TaxID=3072179 RepID=A0AC61D9Y8_9FIRM|nr:hypothetical protein [Sporanaerobium hydrogeniformans]PHV70035.1 hypothetical protein CS063_12890 [Sporanaerobium hydrogeniformans]
MNILDCLANYTATIKKTPYVYTLQKMGIDIFSQFILTNNLNDDSSLLNRALIDKFLLYWVPRNKRYLTETQAYQLVFTINDIYNYFKEYKQEVEQDNPESDTNTSANEPAILNLYGEEYIRLYKVRNNLLKSTKDPIISIQPLVIDLSNYRYKKKKDSLADLATTYEQAIFEVQECKEGGQIILTKRGQAKQYKLLLEYPTYKYFKQGDFIQGIIKRKLFYVYWEIEEIKSYYPHQAQAYF